MQNFTRFNIILVEAILHFTKIYEKMLSLTPPRKQVENVYDLLAIKRKNDGIKFYPGVKSIVQSYDVLQM